jgi:ABC-type dipeptide/oligopeptide/nickel transport system permease component
MSFYRFLIRRLFLMVPLLFGIIFVTFMLVRIGGQDAVGMLAGPMADEAQIAEIRRDLGLDRPIIEQFVVYMGNLVQGDLGKSWQSNATVLEEILTRLPASLELLILAILIGTTVGIPIGLYAAYNPNRLFDQITRFGSLVGFSIPTYWFALVASFVFFFVLRWAAAPMGRIGMDVFPPPEITGSYLVDALVTGRWDAALSAAHRLMLPVIVFAIIVSAPIIKQTRAIALEAMGSDYIRYARACGYGPGLVRRIAMRASLVPVVTFIGAEVATMLLAVSLIELIFAWGGLGQWGLNAILFGDFAAVQGYVLVLASFSAFVFLLVDLIVLVLEPRATLRQ